MTRRLLILTCSARKRQSEELLPAYDRYDGPLWQVLRSAIREQPLFLADVDTYVLSAVYGLIPAYQLITCYDQTMTIERADELRDTTLNQLRTLLESGMYNCCCFGLSQLYLRALTGWEAFIPAEVQVTVANGAAGEKLSQVKAWLLNLPNSPKHPPTRLVATAQPPGQAVVAGVCIAQSREEVLEIARVGLRESDQNIQRYRNWYVLVDGERIAPKWLMSKLTGRSTANFTAADARRGLLALGISVEHVNAG